MSLKRVDRKLGINRTKRITSPVKMYRSISNGVQKDHINHKSYQSQIKKKSVKKRILDSCESDEINSENEHVSKKISNSLNGTHIYISDNESYCSTDNTSRSLNNYIDDEAFEKSGDDESVILTDSNEIVDYGESVGSISDYYISSDDTYERGSFLCSDDSGNEPLLSDSEDELMKSVKPKRKVLPLRDSSTEPEFDFGKKVKEAKETKPNDTNNTSSGSIRIISDEILHLFSDEDVPDKIAKNSTKKSSKKNKKISSESKLESESKFNSEASNVQGSDLEIYEPKKHSLEVKIHLPKVISINNKRKRKRSSSKSLESINTRDTKKSSVITNSVKSSTTSSTISDLRKKIKQKYRIENLRHMSKFRVKELPKNQPQQQVLEACKVKTIMSLKIGEKGVDLSRSGRGIWLVKVPKYIANRWEKTPSSLEAGKLKIVKNPGQKAQVNLSLSEGVLCLKEPDEDDIPKEHRLDIAPVTNRSMAVFSHTNFTSDGANVSYEKLALEGKIVQKLECHPYADEVYMNLKVKSIKKASIPQRKVQQLDRVVTNYKPISHHKDIIDSTDRRKAEGKKARDDKEAVMEVLFSAFEKHQYYNIRDLVKITNQPVVYLKEILKDVCTYNLKNPHKNMWELKPEYRHYKEKTPEKSKSAENVNDLMEE